MINSFEKYVIPSVEANFKSLVRIGDEMGNIILANGETLSFDPEFKLWFKWSYAQEWVNELQNLCDVGAGFPFLFVNANKIKQEGDTFTIKEMVVATQSNVNWSAEEKRLYVINPILLNLRDALIQALRDTYAVQEPFNPSTEVIYSEKENKSLLPEGVDAVLFTNIKIRTIC